MDEALLIDMMSGLEPVLLQNNYIETDMRRGIPIIHRFFPSKKASIFQSEKFFHNLEVEKEKSESKQTEETCFDNRGLNISIFKKGLPKIKIVSSIAAGFVVASGILLIVVKHYKCVTKVFNKKAQIIY